MKRYPTNPILLNQSHDSLDLIFKIEADLFWFQGHFEAQPILPGVTQIEWAIYFVEHYFNVTIQFKGLSRIKFQKPIVPDEEIKLRLTYQADNVITFCYENDEIKSQGRINIQ